MNKMSTPPPEKKRKAGEQVKEEERIIGNELLTCSFLPSILSQQWTNNGIFDNSDVRLRTSPFRYAEVTHFIHLPLLTQMIETFKTFHFEEKVSDLFQFKQSLDLKSFIHPHVHNFMEFLSTTVRSFLKNVTGLPLNDHIDLFLSEYQETDFLLCHDDELDSRRIAFILYLTEDWKSEYGGNLDLYSSTDQMHPDKIVASLTPEFNKFIFFEVGPTSFHQVGEVKESNVSRLALSGWFYGDPLPRPQILFPQDEGYRLQESILKKGGILKDFCSQSYLNSETLSDINEQLTEESQVLIPGFLLDSVYSSICSDIVEEDVTRSGFLPVGPPNLASYHQTAKGPPPTIQDSDSTSCPFNLTGLTQLFHSHEFLQLLETITEFPFTSSPVVQASSSLRKYSGGSYSLMRSGGRKETGEREVKSSEEAEEEDEDPNFVDVLLYFASKWNEGWGGLTIYSTSDGEQLITIPPEGNCLAVVVRTPSVNSYVNYINCGAKDEVYFAYTTTYAFNGTLQTGI